jgi:hypothetical protein
MVLISRAAATSTLRADRSAQRAAGVRPENAFFKPQWDDPTGQTLIIISGQQASEDGAARWN